MENVKVLVIDDSEDDRELIEYFLSHQGADVQLAEDGSEGIDQALDGDFDLVFMDIVMPGIDGHQAIGELRAEGYNKPVIALTAKALASEREKCFREGFDDYLTKPLEWRSLISTAQALLHRH